MTDYFEDLAVGQAFPGGPVTITRDEIIAFGRAYDPQPQHLGEAEAAGSQFGELVASGWHTMALTMRMLVDVASPRAERGRIGAGVDGLNWPAPVRPGDTLRCVSEIVELRPSKSRPDRGLMKLKTTTTNQNGEPVLVLTANIIVLRRPESAGS